MHPRQRLPHKPTKSPSAVGPAAANRARRTHKPRLNKPHPPLRHKRRQPLPQKNAAPVVAVDVGKATATAVAVGATKRSSAWVMTPLLSSPSALMNAQKHSAACALILLASPVLADTCTVRVNAMDVDINMAAFASNDATRRETLLTWPRRSIDQLRGVTPACPSDITLNFMAGIEGLPNSDGYCLADGDAVTGLLLVPGARDFQGRCKRSTCQRINMAADDAVAMTDRMVMRLYQPPFPDSEMSAHASGAMILQLGQSALQDTVEDFGVAALTAILATPEILAATSLSVMAVGGTLWLCNS